MNVLIDVTLCVAKILSLNDVAILSLDITLQSQPPSTVTMIYIHRLF